MPRPLAATTAVAVASTALLVPAVGQGWLGPDVGRGANFCEAPHPGWIRQPANTLSNAGSWSPGCWLPPARDGCRPTA